MNVKQKQKKAFKKIDNPLFIIQCKYYGENSDQV